MRIEISNDLRRKLMVVRESQLRKLQEKASTKPWYDDLHGIDGIHLWGSIGGDLYLTFDGRILLSEDRVDGQVIHEKTCNLAFKSLGLTTGAYANDLPELLDFLPSRPESEPRCWLCKGARLEDATPADPYKRACRYCCGLGWGKQVLE